MSGKFGATPAEDGVDARSDTGRGVFGVSEGSDGGSGESRGFDSAGVRGVYHDPNAVKQEGHLEGHLKSPPAHFAVRLQSPRPGSAVLGIHNGAEGLQGHGVRGESDFGDGVWGLTFAPDKTGVFGWNQSRQNSPPDVPGGNGVFGLSSVPNASGVYGLHDHGGVGVAGYSPNGKGIQGGGEIAGEFNGPVNINGPVTCNSDYYRSAIVGENLGSEGPGSLVPRGDDGGITGQQYVPFDPGKPPDGCGVLGITRVIDRTAVFGINSSIWGRGVQGVGRAAGVGGFSNDQVGVRGESPGGQAVQGIGNYGLTGFGSYIGVFATNSTDVLNINRVGHQNCAIYAYGTLPMQLETTGNDFIIGYRQSPPGDVRTDAGSGKNFFRIDKYGRGFFPYLEADGADVAEFFETDSSIEAGSVVEIDPDRSNGLRLCSTPNSTAVAGVLSSTPGVTLGGGSAVKSASRLALAGRAPVKASAENGAIKPGDLLVAASTPGHAMRRLQPSIPGTIIGKSLGRLDQGASMIEMLVMLG